MRLNKYRHNWFRQLFLFSVLCFSEYLLASDNDIPARAYDYSAVLTLEGISNVHGGIEKGTTGLANVDVTFTVDTDAAGGWKNGTFFIYGLGDYGRNPSDLTGDIQGVSNIATDDAVKLYEFWYQQGFFDDHVKLLAGLHDYNSTFYSLESAGLFTLPPFGIGSEVAQVTPSIFATTATALLLTVEYDIFYLLVAAYDGIPGDPDNPRGTHIQFDHNDGLFKAIESGLVEQEDYKLALGVWRHTALVVNPVDGSLMDTNEGYYCIGEKTLTAHLSGFFQYGKADKDSNSLDMYWGTGITLNDYWKEGDGLGLAVANAHNGSPFLLANPLLDNNETSWELTYYRPLVDHLNAQASLYYLHNPGMDASLNDALAVGMRLYIDW